jgi:hypothetical protein
MKIYHAQAKDDSAALKAVEEFRKGTNAQDGDVVASLSTGAGPTMLVLDLADDKNPSDVLPGFEWLEVPGA